MSATLGPSDDGAPGTVRPASAQDADRIAEILAETWAESLGAESAVALPDQADVAQAWRAAVVSPPDPRATVLVAIGDAPGGRAVAVGVLAHQPTSDPDGDPAQASLISELSIVPGHRGRGHASRLLSAWADTARAARYTSGAIWIPSDAEPLRQLLLECGWAPDTAYRELQAEDGSGLTVVRLVTEL